MRLISKVFFLLLLSVFLISGTAFAATRFLFVAPGETFTPGSAKTGSPLPQVSGMPFSVTVYSVNDSTWQLLETNDNTSLTSSQLATWTPPNSFLLSEDSTVNDCKRTVTITIDTAVTGSVRFEASGSQCLYNAVTITAQKVDNLLFSAISSPQVAGTSIPYTLTARQFGGSTATGFTGSASLSAVYSGQNITVSLGTATFTAGVATGSATLYDATELAQTVSLIASVTVPSGVTAGTSSSFAVNPAAASQLLIIGPGQSINPGVNGGNGRTGSGSITETATTQSAGAPFYVTVYAVDAYWNTVTGATGSVTLSSSDAQASFIPPGAVALSSGKAYVQVTLGTLGTSTVTATHDGVYTGDVVNVPLTYGAIDHFEFTSAITDKTAGSLFLIYAAAHDVYHNVVQNFNQSVTLEALKGGSTLITASHWYKSASLPTFSNGVLNGTVAVRVYERLTTCNLRLTYNTATGISTTFAVNPASFNKLIIMAPGETFDPGAGNPVDDGKAGTPQSTVVGANPLFTVYAVDAYCNQIPGATDTFRITSSDTEGLANSVTQPVDVPLEGGVAYFNFSFMNSGAQGIYCNDITNTVIKPGSVTVSVQAGTIDHFEFTNVNSPVTVSNTTSPVLSARDVYGNIVTSYTGNAWVTSPDTDWTLPAESTINISNGTLIGSAWYVTFTAGQVTLNTVFRRAGSARLFACDDASGTTLNSTGRRGLSTAYTVNPGGINRMQVVVPGQTSRPGTWDGLNGSPTGQVMATNLNPPDSAFNVTVNACDFWWNVITTGTGSSSTIYLDSIDRTNTRAGKDGTTLAQPIVSAGLTAGTVLMEVAYGVQSTNFTLTATHVLGGVTAHTCDPIYIFNVDHFVISGASALQIPDQVVGVPFTITITAYDAYDAIMTGFNNISVEVRDSKQYSDSERTLSTSNIDNPNMSVTFTAGVAIMQVTMYKASTSATGEAAQIQVNFGNKLPAFSLGFNLWWGPVTNVIVMAPGMTHRPGLKHVGIPGYLGYTGSPIVQEAGQPFQVDVIYTDSEYNRVRTNPLTYCKLTSTDPLASIGESTQYSLATSNVYVTVTAGLFTTTTPYMPMRLRTVGTEGLQNITAEPGGALLNNTSPDIPVRHTTHDHFGIQVPTTPQTAGVPFYVTITARDAFQNICDATNLGTPFNYSVMLDASTGTNTMYPLNYALLNGQALASVRLFKAPDLSATIQATYSSITGRSGTVETVSNEFKRLLIMDTTYGGMTLINGRFNGTTPSEDAFPMVEGAPFDITPTDAKTTYQDGSSPWDHHGLVHTFRLFACDAYGNVTATPELAGNTVTITINDIYANAVTPTTIDTTYGERDFDVIFHSAKTGMYISAQTTQDGIADYTTPTFTTYAGPAFGLQISVEGFQPVAGSARMMGSSIWYNGVTGYASSVYTANPFPVTINACDMFGNYQENASNQIYVRTNAVTGYAAYPDSHPTSSYPFIGYLGDAGPGRLTMTAVYDVSAARDIDLDVDDLSVAGPSNLDRNLYENPVIPIVMSGSLMYQIIVNGVSYGLDGTNSTTAVVYPDAFAMTVNIVDAVSLKPVYGVNDQFRLTPMLADGITAAGGTLTVPPGGVGNVVNGVFTTILQTYNLARQIRIMVDNPNTSTGVQTGPRLSCMIDFSANSLNATMSASAVPASIGAGQVSQIRAQVVDQAGNSVAGRLVEFEFLDAIANTSTTGTGDFRTGGTPTNVTTAVTNAQGLATAYFTGGFTNGRCVIRVRYFGNTIQEQFVMVNVSLVDPAVEISNYPNPFAAGAENTNISFYVASPVEVTLKIYNLMGEIVLLKEYTDDEISALINSRGNMVTFVWDGRNGKGKVVGNGGYICAVEVGTTTRYTRKIAVRK